MAKSIVDLTVAELEDLETVIEGPYRTALQSGSVALLKAEWWLRAKESDPDLDPEKGKVQVRLMTMRELLESLTEDVGDDDGE